MASGSSQPWHGRHDTAAGGRFADGMTAWQWLNRDDYWNLKRSHNWRLDKWSRIENIGWCGTLLLRHASDGHRGTSRLEGDGMMSIQDFLNYEMNMALHATPEDVETLIDSQSQTKVRFRVTRGSDGLIQRIGAAQGHSQKALDQFNQEDVLQRATLKDKLLKAVMIHGTVRQFADRIGREGLKAGGERGSRFRGHIHLVGSVEGTKEVCGVRSGSDTLVRVNIPEFMRDGGECFWSTNRVLLTEGLKAGNENFGIPPQYIIDIVDRYTGEVVVPLPTPTVDQSGWVEGASIVAESIVSREEAERIQKQVAFTVGEERADIARAQQRKALAQAVLAQAIALGAPKGRSSQPCEPSLEPAAGAGSSSDESPSRAAGPFGPRYWDAPPVGPSGSEAYDVASPPSLLSQLWLTAESTLVGIHSVVLHGHYKMACQATSFCTSSSSLALLSIRCHGIQIHLSTVV